MSKLGCGVFIDQLLKGKRDFSQVELLHAEQLDSHEAYGELQRYLLDNAVLLSKEPLDISNSDFSVVHMRNLHVPYIIAKEADLRGAVMRGTTVTNGYFRRAQLQDLHAAGLQANGTDFSFANIEGAEFVNAKLHHAWFRGIQGERAQFRRIRAREIDFHRAHLDYASFLECDLVGALFTYASVREAQLIASSCEWSQWNEADVFNTQFPKSRLLYSQSLAHATHLPYAIFSQTKVGVEEYHVITEQQVDLADDALIITM